MTGTYATFVEFVIRKPLLQDSLEFFPAESVDGIALLMEQFFAWGLSLSSFGHAFEAHSSPG